MVARPRRNTLKLISALILICLSIIPTLSPAYEQKDGVPVELAASPPIALPGMVVTLSGTTVTYEKYNVVTIQVIPPDETPPTSPTPINLSTKCDEQGAFSIEFTQTDRSGTYKVSAQSPIGTGTGSAEFQVQPTSGIGSLATSKFEELVQVLDENFNTFNDNMQKLPTSDERDQLIQLSAEIMSQMEGVKQEASVIKTNLDILLTAMDLPPDVLADQPAMELVQELSNWTIEANQHIERLKNLLETQKQQANICDTIHTAGEGLRFASTGLSFYGKGMTVVNNLAVDKGIPLVLDRLYPKRGPAYSSSAKMLGGAAQGVGGLLGGMVGLLGDGLTLITDHLLDRYCGVYSGPIKGTISADFKHLGHSYWQYSMDIEGSLSLRFPKNTAAGGAVRMTGEVFGNATNYTFWEDIEKVMQMPAGGFVLAQIPITPGPFPKLYKDSLGLGKIANLAIPVIFYLPIEARMEDDNVVITFLEPKKEINSFFLKNRLIIIYMAMALPVPVVKYFEFPISGSHFIFTRGMRDPAEVTVSGKGKERAMKKVFERVYEPSNKEFKIEWKVDMNVTHPPKK